MLDQDEVAAAFARKKVAVLVGDWTRGDAAIGRFLEKQGRSGVPLYLWYAPGKPAEVLPQILTVGRVSALSSSSSPSSSRGGGPRRFARPPSPSKLGEEFR